MYLGHLLIEYHRRVPFDDGNDIGMLSPLLIDKQGQGRGGYDSSKLMLVKIGQPSHIAWVALGLCLKRNPGFSEEPSHFQSAIGLRRLIALLSSHVF